MIFLRDCLCLQAEYKPVRPAAPARMPADQPVLQRRRNAAAAASAAVPGGSADRAKRRVEQERRVSNAYVQLRFHGAAVWCHNYMHERRLGADHSAVRLVGACGLRRPAVRP